jgi:amino acid transporter
VLGAAFLGLGAMIGAGIFALLGEAGAIAGSAVWLSFLIAGVIAGLLGYTAAKLGSRYPSSGGLLAYLREGFGAGRTLGVASWLFWFAGLIITAMVAVSFGTYGRSLFFGDESADAWINVLASAVVAGMVAVNVAGAKFAAKAQSAIVVVLLLVFAVFIVATVPTAEWSRLAPSTYPPFQDIAASVGLTFFAYLGFAVISFTAGDLRDPERTLPRAMYLGIVMAAAVYVLISIGTFGALSAEQAVEYGDTALARAAEPSLGEAGFTMMAIAALLATSSSVNANLFAAGSITATLAGDRQFPPFLGRRTRWGPSGLFVSAALVLVLANAFDLAAIAHIGSGVAMVIFLALGVAALRLRRETRSSAVVIATGMVLTAGVLVLFSIDTIQHDPATFVAMLALAVLSFVLDVLWKRARDREPQGTPAARAPAGAH